MPILVSLVVIRLAVRVLRATFPDVAPVRILERSISWLVWIALVLWLSGLLPLILGDWTTSTGRSVAPASRCAA